jgi:hypothetical protein
MDVTGVCWLQKRAQMARSLVEQSWDIEKPPTLTHPLKNRILSYFNVKFSEITQAIELTDGRRLPLIAVNSERFG